MRQSIAQSSKCRYFKILLFYDFLNWDEYTVRLTKQNQAFDEEIGKTPE
jgi:hypothetical protein